MLKVISQNKVNSVFSKKVNPQKVQEKWEKDVDINPDLKKVNTKNVKAKRKVDLEEEEPEDVK